MTSSPSDDLSSQDQGPRILLEGNLLKLSRKKVWQERHFMFTDEHILSYTHEKGENAEPAAIYRITRDAGCQISDLYVEQRMKGSKKESLYCITFTWAKEEHSDFSLMNDSSQDMYVTDDSSMPISMPQDAPRSVGSIGSKSNLSGKNNQFSSGARIKNSRLAKGLRRSSFGSSGDDGSVSSLGTPNIKQSRSFGYKKKSSHQKVPSIVKMLSGGGAGEQKFPEYSTIMETKEAEKSPIRPIKAINPLQRGISHGERSPGRAARTLQRNFSHGERSPGRAARTLQRNISHGERSPNSATRPVHPLQRDILQELTDAQAAKNRQHANYGERHSSEQEQLHDEFYDKEKRKSKSVQKKVIGGTKVVAATGAVVGFGVLTAGVGLAAGLVVLGAAAAAGGTAGVAEHGLKKLKKPKGILIVASANYDVAKLWKSSLDAYLESEEMKTTTWGQKYVAEGRRTTAALVSHDVELLAKHKDLMKAVQGDEANRQRNLPEGQTSIFMRDGDFMGDSAQWRPLESGWTSLLGPGAQSLRIFREEKINVPTKSKKMFRLAVGDASTSAPLKAR
eukprot:scaffold25105_cov191-Cylindrotheca_fusiformis.AAC.1